MLEESGFEREKAELRAKSDKPDAYKKRDRENFNQLNKNV